MVIRIVTDMLLFLFFVFSLTSGLSLFSFPLSPLPFLPFLRLLWLLFCCLSWRFCTTDSVSPAPFTALPNPASRPSTPTKYWLLLICSVSPLPCGVGHRAHVSAVVKRGHGWGPAGGDTETVPHTARPWGLRVAWPFSLAQPLGL